MLQFADIVAFTQLTGHYDAMTLQGGTGVKVVGTEVTDSPHFVGGQWFKTVS